MGLESGREGEVLGGDFGCWLRKMGVTKGAFWTVLGGCVLSKNSEGVGG